MLAEAYKTYEFWLAAFRGWRVEDVARFFRWLASGLPPRISLGQVSLACERALGISLEDVFLSVGYERGCPFTVGIEDPPDDRALFLGARDYLILDDNVEVTQELLFFGGLHALQVNAVRFMPSDDTAVHWRSMRIIAPAMPHTRLVVTSDTAADAGDVRHVHYDGPSQNVTVEFPLEPNPTEILFWYQPLRVDVTFVSAYTMDPNASIGWMIQTDMVHANVNPDAI